MGTKLETGAIELTSAEGKVFRMYGEQGSGHYSPTQCYLIQGLYGPGLFVYATCLQDAFDLVADETDEFDGMYVDDQVEEAVAELMAERGITTEMVDDDPSLMEDIWAEAESDTFTVGGYGARLSSVEWNATEVGRSSILAMLGR